MPHIVLKTLVSCAPEVLFDLARDMDVHTRSVPQSRETAKTSTGKPLMELGDQVTLTARQFGRRWSICAEIVEYDRPRLFVDALLEGPMAAMRHEHEFQAEGDKTRMIDRVDFHSPFGFLGALADRFFIAPRLTSFLTQRAAYLKRLAEASR